MPQHSPLISTIVVGLVLAFALGSLAHRLRISPIVGYLLAGVVVGPFTPGYIADQGTANALAEIGVILLMFGVGLQFSLEELLSVRAIALPGAIIQIIIATGLGMALAWAVGWPAGAGLVFGLALSIASTVVVLRVLQERRLLETDRGKIAIGWLIVEDLAMVLVLVLLPPLTGLLLNTPGASFIALAEPLAITLGKVVAFVALMLIVGKRVIPWILHFVAHTGSRELFRLSVLAIALGVAYGAAFFFDVSFALGAFFAGMILSESALSQRAAQESLPLRDAFAVLFFVSVGMLFDPNVVMTQPLMLIATVFIIFVGKAGIGYGIMRLFGYSQPTALTTAATRGQIGEFSFILAGLGVSLGLLPPEGRDLILASAIITILMNPLAFAMIDRWAAGPIDTAQPEPAAATVPVPKPSREPIPMTKLSGHVVLVGHGRVGSVVGSTLAAAATPLLVIEADNAKAAQLRARGVETILGNAADAEVVRAANFPAAKCLLVAIPDGFEAGQVVEQAHALNNSLRIIARGHSEDELAHLRKHGATIVIMGEHLIAYAMIDDIRAAGLMPESHSAATVATVPPPASVEAS